MTNTEDTYAGYKDKKYIHYREVFTGEYTVQDTKTGLRRVPIREQRIIDFESIKSLNLNTIGESAPTLDTDNFTMIQNYLLDYWGAALGSDCVQVYIHLKRHAYGSKDYCFPDIEGIAMKMGKSKNHVKKCIKILEEYNFLVIFHRRDSDDKNRSVSPLFKIRRHVPLLTEDLYDALPDKIKKDHDKYMKEYENVSISTNELNNQEKIQELLADAELLMSKSQLQKLNETVEEGKRVEYLKKKIDKQKVVAGDAVLKAVSERVSKPSFDTWFKDSVFVLDEEKNRLHVLCMNDFAKSHIKEQFIDIITEEVEKISTLDNREETAYIFKTHEEYILEN
ncbi:helix-turn-helix domain-containing protein [Bacillus cereus]|uniref:helix-turn-helix domain-containing protein n=1 Tax=Bacillus thuringiensis TaxID=1428 RepID=UPI0026E2BCA9|nr:helix-turn-helix domain-containing protein [Bacillus thuringiensis]MDO6628647.1 helix-turn-helix domain-containing protein [Bacillus thuringiensis]MDO6659228.1 helix-turn-helix domain-containing protein [Bacillus thuringiensis]MDO6698810.1 helix-turn-helix domain-containing protein [Bacillus thuringiensis]MEC0031147.1 helix-turn-helix domain-containing protein [Bacillus cereus]